ncbi:MAG: nucleotidyltransferase family protein [Oscillospiraceae bacterium]|nr:nucleotidyltransferase family protein [Oscillospiraceae bacterium]
MKTVGIICEYNPLHKGHVKQFEAIRQMFGEDTAIVCLMSGNFVQRGAPATIDKSVRAQAAVCCGADLVLELPVTYALSSAEGFAAGGVRILGNFCDYLCFGAEEADETALLQTAMALLSDGFSPVLRRHLESGKSFPAARQAALAELGLNAALLETPNNILAVEYCKAILSQGCAMRPLPIHRGGSYHDELPDVENPSATAVRRLMLQSGDFKSLVPENAWSIFAGAPLHTLEAGERAVLAKLRTMTDDAFEALPYGSEGLWRKFMHACRSEATLVSIIHATKSKRYTRTRIDRMILCAFLGISLQDMLSPVPYTRVLAFNDRGRSVLKAARQTGTFLNAGEIELSSYGAKERQTGDLFGLFCVDYPEPPGAEASRRIYYQKGF